MACDESSCLPANTTSFTVKFAVTAPAAGAAAMPPDAHENAQPGNAAEPKASADAPQQALGGVLLSGLGWGLITILTPCVFPLLPVTVSFFSKQKGPALPRSTVYALGIVFT